MKNRATIQLLPDGRRLHLNDGPIDLIVEANGPLDEVRRAYRAAVVRFVAILDELCGELPVLRSQVTQKSVQPRGPIARRMFAAVSAYRDRHFITPMAAVAGAVAEAVLAEMTDTAQLDRAYVNNGGDIALHLAPCQNYAIGMVERPDHRSLFGTLEISAESRVRGIATSGWRGRSFSLGIADAVTVLAETATDADAAATIIANAVDLPNHPAIRRAPARQLAPDSDLHDLLVTRNVGPLSIHETLRALQAGQSVAEQLQAQGLIRAAALCLQGQIHVLPDSCGDGVLRPSSVTRPAPINCQTHNLVNVIPSEARNLLVCSFQENPCPK
jgi:ApbE superfamily uncharacterized protein (UPF0280 family)